MEFTNHACTPTHYCSKCNIFLCNPCAVRFHFEHIDFLRDFKETVLSSLNRYVALKSKCTKALSMSQKLFQYDAKGEIGTKIAILSQFYASFYKSILLYKEFVIKRVRASKHIKNFSARLNDTKESAFILYVELNRVLEILKSHWLNIKGSSAVCLLDQHSSLLIESYRSKVRKTVKNYRLHVQELNSLRNMKVIKAKYCGSIYKISKICKLVYSPEFESIVFKAHYGSSKITTYRCISRTFSTGFLNDYTTPNNFAIEEIDGRLYILGGQRKERENESKYLRSLHVIDMETKSATKLSKMHQRRMCLSSTQILSRYILAVGGYIRGRLLDSCELYCIISNKWQYGPALNTAKSNCGVSTLQERWVYAFAGYIQGKDVIEVECLDLLELEVEKWKRLAVIAGSEWKGMQNPGAVQISNTQVLIFGGVHRGVRQRHTFIFSSSEKIITPTNDLVVEDIFLDCYSKLISGKLHTFSCRHQCMQVFKPKTREWRAYHDSKVY